MTKYHVLMLICQKETMKTDRQTPHSELQLKRQKYGKLARVGWGKMGYLG